MLCVDIPTRSEFATLVGARADVCVSLYLKTTPLTQETSASRIEFGNLVREAQKQLEDAGFDKRRLAALLEQLSDLVDDDEFWRFQANSLAVFATPDALRTYRLGPGRRPLPPEAAVPGGDLPAFSLRPRPVGERRAPR
ncbi:hypothetical protein [Aquamicrobium ahrensii]|uniref:Uncharacterized protein n=1 Tax=Aquamicrobium ahrensii TaxID=469551 RepID=A0ABV2KSQ6_9HYPH